MPDHQPLENTATDPGAAATRSTERPQIPDHELLRPIGGGSYGEVWLAKNVMGSFRAVKLVYRKTFESERPFEREFSGIKKFEPISRSHEGFVDILQVGRNDEAGYFYYVMELADDAKEVTSNQSSVISNPSTQVATAPASETPATRPDTYAPKTLRSEVKRRGRLPIEECLQLSLSLTSALGQLHKQGLIHRDIKPSNIIFVNGLPKLADIGLVASVTEAKSFVGTEGFIPPEGPGTAQADLYSLGKVLYEMSTGKDRTDFPELPTLVREMPDRDKLIEFNEVILKACQNDLQKRYQSAEEMHADVALLQSGKSVKRLRKVERQLGWAMRLGAAAAVAGLLGFGSYYLHQRQQREKLARELAIQENQIRMQKQIAEERRLSLSRQYVEKGTQLLDDRDLLGSLPWFAEALQLDQGDPVREESHRVRLASVLQQSPKLTQLLFHDGPVAKAQFSPDGRRIATLRARMRSPPVSPLPEWETKLHLWDAASCQPLDSLLNRNSNVLAFSFTPSRLWVLKEEEGKILVRDALTGEALTRLFKRDYVRQASGGWTDPAKPDFIFDFSESDPGAKRLATVGVNGVEVSDLAAGKSITLEDAALGGTGILSELAFSPDGRRVLTAGRAGAKVWDAASGRLVASLDTNFVFEAAFSPDGQQVMTFGADWGMRVWDVTSASLVGPAMMQARRVIKAAFSPDAKQLVVASDDPAARIWDIEGGREIGLVLKHAGKVRDAAFSPNGQRVITANDDATACVWDLERCDTPIRRLVHNEMVDYATFSPDGRLAVSVGGSEARIFDTKTGRMVVSPLQTPQPRFEPGNSGFAVFSHDSRRLLTARESNVRLWNTATGQAITPVLEHDAPVYLAAFTGDGAQVVTAFRPWQEWRMLHPTNRITGFRIWNTATGQLLTSNFYHGEWVTSVEFSSDGQRIIAAEEGGSFRQWDAKTGRPVQEAVTQTGWLSYATFSPDRKLKASTTGERTIRIVSTETGKPIGPLLRADHVAFSPDGHRVVGGNRVWDVFTGEVVAQGLQTDLMGAHAQFSPDGKRLILPSAAGPQIWELRTDNRPAEDLRLFAQLLSGQHLDETGALVPLEPARLRDDWESLRAKYPSEFTSTPEKYFAWHEQEAAAHETSWLTMNGGPWQLAIPHLSRLVLAEPARWQLRARRAWAFANAHQWKNAADDLDRAIELGADRLRLSPFLADVKLAMGDTKGYRTTCALLLDQPASDSSADTANLVAWICVLASNSADRLDRVVRLAERAVASNPNQAEFLTTLGAALYRAGRYPEAVERLVEATVIEESDEDPFKWFLLAAAHQRLNHTEEARDVRRQAHTRFPTGFDNRNYLEFPRQLSWEREVEWRLIINEAENLFSVKKDLGQ